MLLVVATVGFMGIALLKPWQAPAPNPSPLIPAPSASAPVATAPLPGAALDVPAPYAWNGVAFAPVSGAPGLQAQATGVPLRVADLGKPLVHDGYGITIVTRVVRPPGSLAGQAAIPIYRVDWTGLPRERSPSLLTSATAGGTVLAVGVTAPAMRGPLDVRFWRLGGDPGHQRLSTPTLAGTLNAGRLFLPPLEDAPSGAWHSGAYQAELLTGAEIVRINFVLPPPDARRDVPRVAVNNIPLGFQPTAKYISEAMAGLPRGPFTINAAGKPMTWPGDAGPPLDEAGAWIASAATATKPVGSIGNKLLPVGTAVARAWGGEPAVIGVGLPRGAHGVKATLVALAPPEGVLSTEPLVDLLEPGPPQAGGAVDEFGRRRALAAFVPPGGTTFAAGVYRIDVDSIDVDGVAHRDSWHVDIAGAAAPPGRVIPALLAAAHRWVDVTPGWGVLSIPPLSPLGTHTTNYRLAPAVPMPRTAPGGSRRPDAELLRCDGAALVDIRRPVFALNLPRGLEPDAIRLVRAFTGTRGVVVPAVIARAARPNVWLLSAPATEPDGLWASGRYQLEVERAGKVALLQVCIGLRVTGTGPGADTAGMTMPNSVLSDTEFRAALQQPGARAWPLLRPGFSPAILGS
jgi:hypothetical protein